MTQEEKDLLLKDLCARLPHGVNMATGYGRGLLTSIRINDSNEKLGINIDPTLIRMFSVNDVKPYLFPISSMTEEQKVEFDKAAELDIEYTITQIKNDARNWTSGLNRFNWLLKNHFDVYDLIPMGLANDATGLNIY